MGEARAKAEQAEQETVALLEEPVDPARRRWEYTTVVVAGQNMEVGLNLAGEHGWEAWTTLGRDKQGGIIVGLKRPKQLIDVVGTMPPQLVIGH